MSLCKDLIFLILQFCEEENMKKTAHMLEQESGYFFNTKYFEELVLDGNWEEVEKYLSSFTGVEDNKYSTKIYFEIRKQKFFEALDKHECCVALDILRKDLKVFAESNKELYKEMAHLLALDDFRENDSLAFYGDTLSARKRIVDELRAVIEANPLLQGRTRFPQINKSRLRRLINQSLNWQHVHCTHPHPQPHIDTLFTDHKCPGPDNMQLDKDSILPQLPISNDSTSTRTSLTTTAIITQDLGDGKNSRDASNIKDEEESLADISIRCQASTNELPIEFPRAVQRVINIRSPLSTMDFHPVHEALLLVGKSCGDVEIWDVASTEKLFGREKNRGVSVNRVLWSPDGSLFGVAYSECMLHLYAMNGSYFEQQWEIDAHVGGVNDVAFSKPYDKFVVVSCGDDKLIKVWDAATGAKQYTFEGHGGPVYSLCPNAKHDIHFLFSVAINGELKAWLFDNTGAKITSDTPGLACMRMAYSSDGKRLFSCGTNKNGDSYIVEWSEREGNIIRSYNGLSKCSSSIAQFDTSINRFLAAGDEHLIKIWDMDSDGILAVLDADGGLPANPHVRFNKKGNLLAVSADDNQIKILANDHGCQLLQKPAFDSGGCLTESFRKLSVEPCIKTETSKIVEVSRCQSVLLASDVKTNLIRRLVYTHAGNGILALAEDGTHLLWKWDPNSSGEATTKCAPQLWQPKSGLLMINDLPEKSADAITPCFSLSKNDSYLISASGRMVHLYNVLVFKKMRNAVPPPPASTCLLFYPPDNNIIAIGMDDATILIYNIRLDKLISKLEGGHSKRISGLAFSTSLNILISCCMDTEIVVWDSITWEKKKSTVLQISSSVGQSETYVELDKVDETHFLAVHETQIAIYETTTLRRVKQWTIANFCTRISHATYSCDSQLVYAAMRDGILLILAASDLAPRFEIDPSAYLPPSLSCYVDPIVVASHPRKPYQFALGLSYGEVVIIEPHEESQGKWHIK